MGICFEGKTLKQVADEREQSFKDTGCAYGLEKMELLDKDPAKFMRFQMRLVSSCIGAREMAKLISANPASLIQGELLFMLATPEGDVVSASYGLAGHALAFPFMIRAIADLGFEDDPGINLGDVFFNNDPLYGAPHNADCYTFMPIFYKGELIGWTVGLNHIVDVGSLQPGGLGMISPNIFTDGFTCPPSKVGADFKTHRWWDLHWKRRTRTEVFNVLDDKMRTAGAKTLHDRILEIVEEFGVDYYRQATKEILERERRLLVDRIKTMAIPGKYSYLSMHLVNYKGMVGRLFPSANRDWTIHLPADLTVLPDGRLHFDLEGMSSEGEHHENGYESSMRMLSALGAWPMFAYTQTLNTALLYMTDWNIPPGCLFKPQNPYAGTIMNLYVSGKYIWAYHNCLSLSFFARGYLEECFPQDPSGVGYGLTGVLKDGFPWAGGDMTLITCWASGATPFKDGDPAAVCSPNPAPDQGETELAEFLQPTNINLGRILIPNYCGHGKFRGGLGTGICQMIVEPGRSLVVAVMGGTCGQGRCATGMSGGYPGNSDVVFFAHDTNVRELVKEGQPLPRHFLEIQEYIRDGRLKAKSVEIFRGPSPNIPLKDGDLMACASGARIGWGDPLERRYSLVEKDVRYGWITPEAARSVYSVVTGDKGQVNAAESDALRAETRRVRREQSMDVKEWWKEEREKVLAKRFTEPTLIMYEDCLKWPKFRREFLGMWQLPDDYNV